MPTGFVEAINTAITPITDLLTVGNVTTLIAAALSAGAVLFLLWWGVRKLFYVVMDAFRGHGINV